MMILFFIGNLIAITLHRYLFNKGKSKMSYYVSHILLLALSVVVQPQNLLLFLVLLWKKENNTLVNNYVSEKFTETLTKIKGRF